MQFHLSKEKLKKTNKQTKPTTLKSPCCRDTKQDCTETEMVKEAQLFKAS